MTTSRFTDDSVPETGIRRLFTTAGHWQRWLDVEAALALAEADAGVVPPDAAAAIAGAARLDRLDKGRIRAGIATTGHPLMPLITELTRVVGADYGGWVHWGATTQNITQTGDALLLRDAHRRLLGLLGRVLAAAAELAERGARMPMAGRTHGQHAVPVTFGFKAAVWIDELLRHLDRLRRCEPAVFVAMLGGAVGTHAALGADGPRVQARLAERLGLWPMAVPARSTADGLAEYVCVLALLAGTGGKIGRELYSLMQTEYGEVLEPAAPGDVGSSTMPHKRNPKLSQDMMTISAQIRALVPQALEGMHADHEADGAYTAMLDDAVTRACVLAGDQLVRLAVVLEGLELDPSRMRANLDLTGGLIVSEAVMLALGKVIGRQEAHRVVSDAAHRAAAGEGTFAGLLDTDPRVTTYLSATDLRALLDPTRHLGLSAELAAAGAARARAAVQASWDVSPAASTSACTSVISSP
ncbi:class-II fumarase/aspartase family protein [Dactylosporangium sp. CA-052675]|uniref:class-II fumarase/aspartase family protein n=1 Tax=Dactylosporangium sp. CA-052675 TaxID=3239927 RepID=UPI003D8F4D11